MLTAADIMTTKVGTVYADTSLRDAAELMLTYGVSGVPVLARTGELVGLLSDADLLRRAELGTDEKAGWLSGFFHSARTAEEYARSHGRTVHEVMTREVVTVEDGSPLSEVVRLMQSHGVKRLPVIGDGKLVGIVSRIDLLRALVRMLPNKPVDGLPDSEIQKLFLAELGKQPWVPKGVGAKVKSGVILIEGVVTDRRERRALRVLVENTPGCRGVTDQLVCIEPISGVVLEGSFH